MNKFKALAGTISVLMLITGCNNTKEVSKTDLVINEFKANIAEDEHSKQYIELRGEPSSTIKDTYIVVIDGDDGEEGHVDYAYNLSGVKVGSNGLIILKNKDEYNDIISSETTIINDPLIRTYNKDVDGEEYEDGILEHDAITYALITSSTEIKKDDDLDTNNDGILDLSNNAKVIDSLGSLDGGDGFVYSENILTQSASDPDAATRFYDDLTSDSLTAWANGDIYEDPNKDDSELSGELLYDTLQASSNLPPKASLSPGTHNFKKAPFIIINEVVNNENKYIELLSNPSQSLKDVYLLVINNDTNTIAKSIDLSQITAKETGLTIIRDLSSTISLGSAIESLDIDLSLLSNDKTALVLAYSKTESIKTGDTFTEDDIIILDNIGWGGTNYSNIVTPNDINVAIRYKDNKMSSLSAWSFEEVYKTPANTNISENAKLLVKPTLETARTTQKNPDADDIAFWVHPTDNTKSLIIGTQKKAGYSIYDVDGNTLLDVNPGNIRFNNVDIIYGFDLNGTSTDIAIFTDRITNKFAIYKISETAPYLTDLTDYNSAELFVKEDDGDSAYGQAVYKSLLTNKVYAYATQNGHSLAAQFELKASGEKIAWTKIRTITLSADDDDKHAEGMVVDQEYGKLYIDQEDVGIYTTDAEVTTDTILDENDLLLEVGDNQTAEDLEGITLYYKDSGEGYLIVSSQGNNTFAVFNRTAVDTENSYIDSFIIVADMNGIDAVQETDSIDVTNIAIGTQFPNGAFIVQDGMDTTVDPDDTATNFKWVKWEDIASKFGDTNLSSTYNPRTPSNRR